MEALTHRPTVSPKFVSLMTEQLAPEWTQMQHHPDLLVAELDHQIAQIKRTIGLADQSHAVRRHLSHLTAKAANTLMKIEHNFGRL